VSKVSIILPSRNEQFLPQTIDDLCQKARGDIEIIAILDGYWPDRISNDKRVHYIHYTKPQGMRPGLNAGVAIARGDYVMKLDAHCMVSEGFDVVLSETCRDNWMCVPTRKRLDAENWQLADPNKADINYLYIDLSNDELNGKVWHQKNVNKSLEDERIVDLIACQGSCYFMPRAWWHELELLDTEHYGTFRKDPQEVIFKTWTNGGRCVRVKDCWYAHLHKGKRYGRGYASSPRDWAKGDEYVKLWWANNAWPKQKIPLNTIIKEHFADMPGWTGHPWVVDDVEPPPVTEVKLLDRKLPNMYQVLKVGDEYFTRSRPEREGSRFWNEGRWQTFITPLLSSDATDQTFVEMGADCGLFLKLARDYGYRRAIGIEKNQTPVKVGNEWKEAIGGDWTLLKRTLGGKFGEAAPSAASLGRPVHSTLTSCPWPMSR
jgi:glycosyltransferase involved in cell wall biosynthesis